jgi:hypothetical protein
MQVRIVVTMKERASFTPGTSGSRPLTDVPIAAHFVAWLKDHEWTEIQALSSDDVVALEHPGANSKQAALGLLSAYASKPTISANGADAWEITEEGS